MPSAWRLEQNFTSIEHGPGEYEPAKLERASLRWFGRYLDEGKDASLLKAHLALGALSELRLGEGDAAAKLLIELAR
jgi:hypothetical protein